VGGPQLFLKKKKNVLPAENFKGLRFILSLPKEPSSYLYSRKSFTRDRRVVVNLKIRTLRTRRLWSLSFAVLPDLGHPACEPYLEAQRKRTEHPQDIYASRRIPVIQSSTFILQITSTNSFRNLQASGSVGTPITHLSCSSSQFSIGRRHRPHRHQLDHYHQL